MKILALTRYERSGASSRIRSFQYHEWLQAAGIETVYAPMFSDAYVQGLQRGHRNIGEVLSAYFSRIKTLLTVKKFDLLWIEKECLPWLPSWIERCLLPSGIPYVLDYDDAVFHYYDEHRRSFVRRFLSNKHPELMRGAALVVAGNQYLMEFSKRHGASRVEIVASVIDLERYPVIATNESEISSPHLPCIGWIGQRATAHFLRPLSTLFQRLAEERRARFTAIGIDTQALGLLPMTSIPWSEHTEFNSIRSFDIGIMPLANGPFERGKCGYKLIQYMACGLPVVASPVGINQQIVEHGINGFLAETPAEWAVALETLLSDVGLRKRMGQAGRQKVEQEYCIQVTGPKMVELLREAAAR